MIRVTEGREHSRQVRARARHIRELSLMQTRGFRSTARLAVIAAYSILFMWGGFFDWNGSTVAILWIGAAILWLVIASVFVRGLIVHERRWHYLGRHLALPLLLIAPAFLWISWWPAMSFALVVVAYILELRYHSAGDGFLFSFGLVLFVGVFAALSMVEIESEQSSATTLRTPKDAIYWAFGSLLRINYGEAYVPQTHDGKVLAAIVAICAVLGASLFTAQMVSWVVGSRAEREKEKADDEERLEAAQGSEDAEDLAAQLAAIRAELAMIRSAMGLQTPDRPSPQEGTVAP